MLYGNIIFIKKTGGDGSKYPVSEKSLKIGRSEKCLIRIYNSEVALEHCQLIIGENGQATLRDLSSQTFLNGNVLANEEATLCHGDVFKVGERLARWEYLPTSKYYRQLLSPTGRLVAVVMPQKRYLEDQISETSASAGSAFKGTPLRRKRSYSEKLESENTSTVKRRKSGSSSLLKKSKGNLSKLLTGRHSLKTKKLLLPVAKIKDRKSTSEVINSRTPKGRFLKSALPSWNIKLITSPTSKLAEKETYLIINSTKSSNNRGKNFLKDTSNVEPENLWNDKKKIKTPQKGVSMSRESIHSPSKDALEKPVQIPVESPLKIDESIISPRRFRKSLSPRKPQLLSATSKSLRLVQSENKMKSSVKNVSVRDKEFRRFSLLLKKIDESKGNNESFDSFSHLELKGMKKIKEVASDKISQTALVYNSSKRQFSDKREKRSSKMPTPEKFVKTSNKSSQNKIFTTLNSSGTKMKASKITESKEASEKFTQEKSKTPATAANNETSFLKESGDVLDPKNGQLLKFQKKAIAAKSTPLKKTPRKTEKSAIPSSTRKNSSKTPSKTGSNTPSSNSARSSKSSSARNSSRKAINHSKEKISTPRVARRKLSPSISSAERAAKKLKTSCPRKPDKNKKAALLVLGKANRKQLLAQNLKVMLKQKIVKKAIKQSALSTDKLLGLFSQMDGGKKESVTEVKPKKVLRKNVIKTAKKTKQKTGSRKKSTPANSSKSSEAHIQSKDKMEDTSKGENELEGSLPRDSNTTEMSPRSPAKFKNLFSKAPGKSPSNQHGIPESPQLVLPTGPAKETSSPFPNSEKTAENFSFNSNRRCSKRLSSKNDLGRPDFVELSPTALGLIPKNIEVFKSSKQRERKSSSLVTPKNVQSTAVIKSASTSKIGNRKNVRFSSKDVSLDSEFCTPGEKTDFDFGAFQTPDVSVDVFISPLGEKTSDLKKSLNETPKILFAAENNSELLLAHKSSSEPRKCIRKLLQSPEPRSRASTRQNELRLSRSATTNARTLPTDVDIKNSKSNLSDFDVEVYATTKNNLPDVNGVLTLLRTAKNDSADSKVVRKKLIMAEIRKSPKNDLSDVRGVKRLMATRKVQKSPKNDLTDVRGVKKLMRTPKVQKSPKNDLSDLRGVKKLMRTPKVQKSPKNDLTDVRGVKKLMRTPKVQKSPKNDLTDVRGVKKLLKTPKVQKSPKNSLANVDGVKALFKSPRAQKSPKNELLELSGVQQLFESPQFQQNSLKDASESGKLDEDGAVNASSSGRKGQVRVKATLKCDSRAVKVKSSSKEPKNDLADVTGVRELFARYETDNETNESLMEIPEQFNLSEAETILRPKGKMFSKKSTAVEAQKAVRSEKATEETPEHIQTRRGRRGLLSEVVAEAPRRSVRARNLKTADQAITELTETKPNKQKVTERNPNEALKSPIVVKKSKRVKDETERKRRTTPARTKAEPKRSEEIKTRKRKAEEENVARLQPKVLRKLATGSVRKTSSRSKTPPESLEKISVGNVRKAPGKAKSVPSGSFSIVQSKESKTNVKRVSKVQKKKSQESPEKNPSDSEKISSPIQTRSGKRVTSSREKATGKRETTAGTKISESRSRRKKLTTAKKSMKRK